MSLNPYSHKYYTNLINKNQIKSKILRYLHMVQLWQLRTKNSHSISPTMITVGLLFCIICYKSVVDYVQ
jgi:hypothetical protein